MYISINARHVLWHPPPPFPIPHFPQTSVKTQHPLEEYPKTIYMREKSDVQRDYINAQLALFWQYQNLAIPYPDSPTCPNLKGPECPNPNSPKCPNLNPNGPVTSVQTLTLTAQTLIAQCPNPNGPNPNGPVSKP